MSWFAQDDAAACSVSAALAVFRSAGRERALDCPQGVSGSPLQGAQVKPFNLGEYLPPFLRDQIVTPGQVPCQVDIAGCRVETQVRQGAGVGVQRIAPASWLNR